MSKTQSGKSFRSFIGIPPSQPTVSNSALIIIDAQNEYDYGLLAISELEQSRPKILSILEKYRGGKGDIIHAVHDTPVGTPPFTPGTPLAEIFPELTPLEGEKIVHKTRPSAFTDTILHEHLQNIGKNKIVLVGYMAHNCISSTSRFGAELDYDVSVVRDAIGDIDVPGAPAAELVKAVLGALGDVSATIISSEDL